MGKYGSVWGKVKIKTGPGGAGNVTEEENNIISAAVDAIAQYPCTKNRQEQNNLASFI